MSIEQEEDDMMSEEEQEEADREFLQPIFFLSMAHIDAKPPDSYDVYIEGNFRQQHIDRLNKRFKIIIIESYCNGLHIGLKRWQEIPRK